MREKTVAESGCEIVRNITEAFTVYDINTSQSRHGDSAKDNFRRVNETAVRAVIDDIHKYNISGIIMVDLVGEMTPEEKTKLMKRTRDIARRVDKSVSVHDITKLGILEITRKKEQKSLMDIIGKSCSECSSTSGVISPRYYLSWIHGIVSNHMKAGFRGVEVVSGASSSSLVLKNATYFSELTGDGKFAISVTQDSTMDGFAFRVRPVGISSSAV
jgi:Ribonuclease G/E